MNKKIVYICYMPLSSKIENDFFLDFLVFNGIDIEYWDVTNLFFKNLSISDEIERSYVSRINSYNYLSEKIKDIDIDHTLFVILITYDVTSLKLYRLLTKANCKICFFARGYLPAPVFGFIHKTLKSIKKFNYQNIFSSFFKYLAPRVYKKIELVKPFDFVFTAGSIAEIPFSAVENIVHINHFDYDSAMFSNGLDRLVSEQYCVFLDEYFPHHPDYKMFGLKTIDADRYYNSLSLFFDMVEKQTGLSVVIAAHPKSEYGVGDSFQGRKIFKYKTNELVKCAEFSIAHMSTSISYSVLYNKPIVFLYSDDIKRLYYLRDYQFILNFSVFLNCSIYNIDNIMLSDTIEIKPVDKERYKKYLYDFLTSPEIQHQCSRNIVLDFFKCF